MEPAGTKIRYVIYTTVRKVDKVPIGYFVHFDGSHESIYLGDEATLVVGDKVKITFEKVDNANT